MNASAPFVCAVPTESSSERIDHAMILDRVGGDKELLYEIAAIFLEEYPSLLHDIKAAVSGGDAKRLERAAHSLKGSVGNFGAHSATQAAYRLEISGRQEDLRDAPVALEHLITEFRSLQPDLERLAAQHNPER